MDRRLEKLVKRTVPGLILLLGCGLALWSAPARGDELCSIDERPAATLLLPYFEVDPSHPSGLTTLFSINNASPEAVMTHVTVWTDMGVPTLGFLIYLTGYDVQTINLRDLFNGVIPRTAPAGEDPTDTISPHGFFFGGQDTDFPSCAGLMPLPPLPPDFVTHLRAAHSGKFSSVLKGCAGQDLGDGHLRGYVTVDTVSECTLRLPLDVGYFGPHGVVTNQNVLWGDYLFLDPDHKVFDGENLVHVKAFPGAFHQGDLTFYGRYVGSSGEDERQPLPTAWASRYVNGGATSGSTELLVWRDSGRPMFPFTCGTLPFGFPLGHAREITFNEEEQIFFLPITPQPGDQTARSTPVEANRVRIGGPTFPVDFAFGWVFLDLDAPPPGGIGQVLRQSWVETILSIQGQFSAGFSATPLASPCAPNSPIP